MLKDAWSARRDRARPREANEPTRDVGVERRDRSWWSRRRIDRDVAGRTANLQIDSRVYTDVHTLNVRFRLAPSRIRVIIVRPTGYRTRSSPPRTWRAIDIDADAAASIAVARLPPRIIRFPSPRKVGGERLRARFELAAQSSSKGNVHPLQSPSPLVVGILPASLPRYRNLLTEAE